MKNVILVFMLVSNWAMADEWFCTHEAGKREGKVFWSCGIGIGHDEASARHNSLINAKLEFETLCQMSKDCRDSQANVSPQRTSCEINQRGVHECHRLLIFTLE